MKVTSWTFGGNQLFDTGSVYLVAQPRWLAAAEWIIESVIGRGCSLFHWIPLPNRFHHRAGGVDYTWKDWYGDFGHLYHAYVYEPMFYWHQGHPKRQEIRVEMTYGQLRSLLYRYDADYFEEHEDIVDQNR